MQCRGIVIGAGVIGSAIAFELSRRGCSDVVVLDPDLEGALSSTERNAGGVRHLWQEPVNSALARCSIEFFAAHALETGFHPSGYFWLYSEEKAAHGERVFDLLAERGLPYERIGREEIPKRYPFLDKLDGVAFGLLGKKDGILNSNALKIYYRSQAAARGVKFLDRHRVLNLTALGPAQRNHVEVRVEKVAHPQQAEDILKHPTAPAQSSEQQVFRAEWVVVAAGAWSETVLANALRTPAVTRAVRRQISFFKTDGLDLTPYGMFVDTSGVYFHAEGGNVLAGKVLKEEADGFHFHYDTDFFESHIWPALYERSSQMERLKPVSGWGGLYSYTPDISGILGRVPGYAQIYESHSFTGHGVMQSYGAAVALADLLLEGRFNRIDAAQLSRERFALPPEQWLQETLHI